MFGLTRTGVWRFPLLNAEGVFTALLAWFVFLENFDRRIALGMPRSSPACWCWVGPGRPACLAPAELIVLGACLAWAIDNNLTRKVSLWMPLDRVGQGAGFGCRQSGPGLCADARLCVPERCRCDDSWLLAYGVSLALFVVSCVIFGTATHRRVLFSGAVLWRAACGGFGRGRDASIADRWRTYWPQDFGCT